MIGVNQNITWPLLCLCKSNFLLRPQTCIWELTFFNISYMLWGCDSLLLITLSVFDIFVVFLLWLQYHHLSQKRSRKWHVLHSKSATRAQSKSIARHQKQNKIIITIIPQSYPVFYLTNLQGNFGSFESGPCFSYLFCVQVTNKDSSFRNMSSTEQECFSRQHAEGNCAPSK